MVGDAGKTGREELRRKEEGKGQEEEKEVNRKTSCRKQKGKKGEVEGSKRW